MQYMHLPTVPTYLRHTLEQVRPFSNKRKKDVPSTELAREGQFLAKVAEGKSKKSFLYNKNY